MCLWSNCFSWFCPLAPYVIIWPIVQSHGGCGENRRLLLCMVCKFSWPEVLVLSVFKAHRDLSICMTLKIKKSFSLCFRSAKYNSTCKYAVRISYPTEFFWVLSAVLCWSKLWFETFQHFSKFLLRVRHFSSHWINDWKFTKVTKVNRQLIRPSSISFVSWTLLPNLTVVLRSCLGLFLTKILAFHSLLCLIDHHKKSISFLSFTGQRV